MSSQQRIKTALRVRPSLPHELAKMLVAREDDEIECSTEHGTIKVANKGSRYKFDFDSVHSPESTQLEVFTNDVVPMLDKVYQGMSCTVFSYGVTGSGKTHTMQGVASSSKEMGIIPRTIAALFLKQKRLKKSRIEISIEYLEIYCDDCFDLLVPPPVGGKPRQKINVLTNAEGKNIVHNLTRVAVGSAKEFETIYNDAAASRSTASTKLNSASSRSHAVLTVYVKIEEVAGDSVLLGRINLVDLAGSENNKLTGNDKIRMAESSAINKSLTTLGNVIDAVNRGLPRVPYRDSKLTRILQDTLGGSSVGLLICNISPGATFRQDTLNTLNFATRTKEVENRADINIQERPAPKPHFAALTKKPVGQGAVYRDNLGPPSRPTPIGGVPSRPASAAAAPVRRVFGEVAANPVVVRVVPSVGGGLKGKGGGKMMVEDEAAEEMRIKKLVDAALNARALEEDAKRAEERKQLEMLIEKDARRDARLTAIERDAQQRKDKDEAMELMNAARQHHDHAFKHGDRSSLYQALTIYKQAYSLLPSNAGLKKRVAELEAASLDTSLPIPPRKATAAPSSTQPPPAFDPAPASQPVASTSHLKRSHKETGLARLSDGPSLDFAPLIHPTQEVSRPKKSLAAKGKERARQSPVTAPEEVDGVAEEPLRVVASKPTKASVKAAPRPKAAAPAKKKATSKPTKKARTYSDSEEEDDFDGEEEKDSGLGEDEVVPVAKGRGVRTAARKKAVVVVVEESDEEDDLGGYDDDEEEEEWRPEPVEVGKRGSRRG